MPSITFVATANAVAYTGAKPVFADIVSPTEPWLDPESVAPRITPRTKAIMSLAYGGHPGESQVLRTLADDRGLLFLEDAAHALGTRIGGHLGTLGFAGAYSFFSNKNLALGEGRHGRLCGRLVGRPAPAVAVAWHDGPVLGSPPRPRFEL